MRHFTIDYNNMEKLGGLARTPQPTTKQKRTWRAFLLKLSASVCLLAFLFLRMDVSSLYRTVVSANPYPLILGAGVLLTAKMITAVRWAVLARKLGFKNSLAQFFLYYLFGMFFNLFMPSTVGGDAVRVIYLFRDKRNTESDRWKVSVGLAALSVVADRLAGVIVLLWIGAAALLAFPAYANELPSVLRYSIWLVATGSVLVWPLLWLAGLLLQSRRGFAWIKSVQEWVTPFRSDPLLVVQTILLSLIIHFLQAWIQILVGRSINLYIPWSYCFIFFPLVDTLSMLPVSVNGIGLREGGYFYFLGKLNIAPEQSVACALLWFVIVLFNGLFGGIVFLLHKRSAAAPSPEESPQVSG